MTDSIILKNFNSKYLGKMKNRTVMSAMTRNFADRNHYCTDEMAAYYERRAKDGVALILTEGIIIHPSADGYNNVPYIWKDEHAQSWEKAVNRVHECGSKIYAQLWHCGRISHTDYTGGIAPVSSTNQQASGINRQNNKPYSIPRALAKEEIPKIIEMFVNAAKKAFLAGFDGVELHCGHGYLVDQFFDARVNDRSDEYGGSVEGRCRFVLELVETMIKKIGNERLMIRISPSRRAPPEVTTDSGGLYNWDNLDEMLEYLIPGLDKLGLRQLDISCANANYFKTSGLMLRKIRKSWPYFLMGGASLTHQQAIKEVEDGLLDMVTWGRHILANPDFISKLKNGEPLVEMTNEMRGILY